VKLNSHRSSAEVKQTWIFTSTPPYALVKRKGAITERRSSTPPPKAYGDSSAYIHVAGARGSRVDRVTMLHAGRSWLESE
jgi:hypothetical protein